MYNSIVWAHPFFCGFYLLQVGFTTGKHATNAILQQNTSKTSFKTLHRVSMLKSDL